MIIMVQNELDMFSFWVLIPKVNLNLFLLEPMKMVVLPRYIQNQEKTFGEL